MSTQEVLNSKGFKIAALAVGVVIISVVSFGAGVAIGFKKAKFSYKFGENYERNFVGGPFQGPMGTREDRGPRDMMRGFEGRGFRNAHGIAGTIISIADNKVVIKDRNGQENTISVSEKTLIKRGQDTININDLENDDRIVVMGKPGDDGTMSADLIRVFSANENN
ncbi:MAG: hypothetical protein A3J76_04495 [Candidatus Moranbacteria bacterium RBG_13_45_13]|nr:MAG: hypothetical protein A3J76_04495 [Candidatus Moranbacteria bacterium RBG_13_45_13]